MNKLHIQPCWTCKKCYAIHSCPKYEWDGTEEAHGE